MAKQYVVLADNHVLSQSIEGAATEGTRMLYSSREDKAMIVYEVTPVWSLMREVMVKEKKIGD